MIDETWRQDLHRYMAGVIKGLEAKPIIVNGVADHVHVLMGIKPSQAISDLVRELKKASSNWAATRSRGFGWQTGYAAFAVSSSDTGSVTFYIAGQESHHRQVTWDEELRALLAEHGIEFDERFFH